MIKTTIAMLSSLYLKKGFWIYTALILCGIYFMLDEIFIFALSYVPEELRLLIHRMALFIVVAAFTFITQFFMSRLVVVNQQLLHSGRLSALGEMSAMFTHELIRPLTKLDMFVQIELDKQHLDPEIRKFCLDVGQQLERAKVLIHSLRTFGRSSGETERQFQSINAIVEETLNITEPYLQYVNFRKNLSPNLPTVLCDTYQIEQVLTNLLINARDALEGCKEKSISLQTRAHGQYVEIAIADSGLGIKAAHLKNIFDPFFTTKESSKGTGLGLAIARKIILDHGGRISVDSAPGKTVFLVHLPIANPSAAAIQSSMLAS